MAADDSQNNEDRIYQFKFLAKGETNDFSDVAIIGNQKWFRVGCILNLQSITLFANKHQLVDDEIVLLEMLQSRICKDQVINYYEEDTVAADEAVNIFIRINAGGTYLSLSDILMSILRAGWTIDARKAIQNIIDRVAAHGFHITNDYIIKALLFLKSSNINNRIQNFDNRFLIETEREWSDIADCIDELFKTIKTFQLNHSTLLSYNATLPILYYMYSKKIYTKFASSKTYEQDRKIVKLWLVKALLLKTFGGHSDSVLTNARKVLGSGNVYNVFPAKEISRAIHQPSAIGAVEIDELLDVRKDDRLAFLVLTLLYPDYSAIALERDHMHPIAMYDTYNQLAGSTSLGLAKYDSVVNLQLLPSSDNSSKSDMSLEDWIKSRDKMIYKTSYIPDVDLALSNFNKFYEERKKILAAELAKLLATPERKIEE
jgi:hypothetical protein